MSAVEAGSFRGARPCDPLPLESVCGWSPGLGSPSMWTGRERRVGLLAGLLRASSPVAVRGMILSSCQGAADPAATHWPVYVPEQEGWLGLVQRCIVGSAERGSAASSDGFLVPGCLYTRKQD